MRYPRILFLCARLVFMAFLLVSSLYCLLYYVPFTYFNLIQLAPFPALNLFVKHHTIFYWLVHLAFAPTVTAELGNPKTRRLVIEFLAFHVLVGISFLFRPLPVILSGRFPTFLCSIACLLPLLWIAIIDYIALKRDALKRDARKRDAGKGDSIDDTPGEFGPGRKDSLVPALAAAIFTALVYAVIFLIRSYHSADSALDGRWKVMLVLTSLALHIPLFIALLVPMEAIKLVTRRIPNSSNARLLLYVAYASLLSTLFLRKLVLPTIALGNWTGYTFAAIGSFCVAAYVAGLRRRPVREIGEDRNPRERPAQSRYRLFGVSLSPRPFYVIGLALLAYWIPSRLAHLDWDFIFQKSSVVLIWTMTFIVFYSSIDLKRRSGSRLALFSALACCGLASLGFLSPQGSVLSRLYRTVNMEEPAKEYAANDLSFRVVSELLSPSFDNGAFERLLNDNSNIPESTAVAPVDVKLVADLHQTPGPKPNIFIFVIDSLRRDYVSTYNKDVTFTPAIDEFARDSVVMQNSFTRYGGTALAEPSIWVGGMLLHKQYIEPFYPMNSLQKLLDADGYRQFISVDKILAKIVADSPAIVNLDSQLTDSARLRAEFQFDFSDTLGALRSNLDQLTDRSRPLFVYAQPLDCHWFRTYNRPVPDGETYPGFYAPYAHGVAKIDRCFGEFISYLKQRGLYDNSIIILTSDHGDSEGEGGRYGHSTWIYPEIMKIPMIIHVPGPVRKGLICKPDLISFSTDITPTLYYLLGHRPILHDELTGRPLFTQSEREQTEYLHDQYLVASSYGPVYGILSDQNRTLYVANGIENLDYMLDLDGPSGLYHRPTAEVRAVYQDQIRDEIKTIARHYRFGE